MLRVIKGLVVVNIVIGIAAIWGLLPSDIALKSIGSFVTLIAGMHCYQNFFKNPIGSHRR